MASIWNATATTNPIQLGASLEPVTVDIYRYVNVIGEDGWIQGLEGTETRLPLCKYTKVMLLETKKSRTTFKVLDGTYAGRTLSMKEENATKYLGTVAPKNSVVEVVVTYGKYEKGWMSVARNQTIDQQWATVSVDGLTVRAAMNSVWGHGLFPIPPGEYSILVPDVPHAANMTTFYRNVEPTLKHDQVWFPIKYGNNSRYVHVGNLSDGCTTVVDLAKWADLHEKLISHRSTDKKVVGKLIVKGNPERAK